MRQFMKPKTPTSPQAKRMKPEIQNPIIQQPKLNLNRTDLTSPNPTPKVPSDYKLQKIHSLLFSELTAFEKRFPITKNPVNRQAFEIESHRYELAKQIMKIVLE